MKRLTGPLRLVPVVELEPSALCPDRPWEADVPSASHWRACADAAGLRGLEPMAPGSWLVRTSDLPAAALELLVRTAEGDVRDDASIAAPLDLELLCGAKGGLVLEVAGAIELEPTCCGCLDQWAGWRDAAARREPGWAMLWIGHPWVATRIADGRVIISGPHESSDPPEEEAFSVDAAELAAAVERARLELVAFADALRPIVVARGHDPRLADALAGVRQAQ